MFRGVRIPTVSGNFGDSPGGGAAPAANPNLLLWTEALDNAVYVKTGATVVSNYGDGTYPTADQVTFASSGVIEQTTSTPATTGAAATALVTCDATWQRREVTGAFDGLDYTFSVETIDRTGGSVPQVRLRIERAGGLLRAGVEDLGDEAIAGLARLQLEQASSATAYQAREGA